MFHSEAGKRLPDCNTLVNSDFTFSTDIRSEPCIRKLVTSNVKYLMPTKKMKEILKLRPPARQKCL